MSIINYSIGIHATLRPGAIALKNDQDSLTYAELERQTKALAANLHKNRQTVALLADNGPAWAVVDLAAMAAGVTLVPIPAFFSNEQILHVLADAGVTRLISDNASRIMEILPRARMIGSNLLPETLRHKGYSAWSLATGENRGSLEGIGKITYTSGTTSEPKGVCLNQHAMEQTTIALLQRVGTDAVARHVSLLPLATLLENIAGLYLPLLSGGCCHLPRMIDAGVYGAAALDAGKMTQMLQRHRATSTILIPEMLRGLLQHRARVPSLRFVAVGGAAITEDEILQARDLGLPVYQGYGLSECSSVVSLNAPGSDKSNSVGKALDHVQVRVGDNDEIEVRGSVFSGYLGDAAMNQREYLATGDLGYIDDDGFLYITGRKKNMYITAYGRNISPDWIESELLREPGIDQVCVYGDGKPFNVAIVVNGNNNLQAVSRAIQKANARLPDYARIEDWIRADAPFSTMNHQCTGNGRLRRQNIFQHYENTIQHLYRDNPFAQEQAS